LPSNQSREEAEANAKLIASSPDMLQALQAIKQNIEMNLQFTAVPTKEEMEAMINTINRAINKVIN